MAVVTDGEPGKSPERKIKLGHRGKGGMLTLLPEPDAGSDQGCARPGRSNLGNAAR
jgi:hypothetical protein